MGNLPILSSESQVFDVISFFYFTQTLLFSRLSSIPMTLEVSWNLVTTSVALATSSREIRWSSPEEIQSIVRAMQGSMVAVLLVIGTAGTMPLTRLSISITCKF